MPVAGQACQQNAHHKPIMHEQPPPVTVPPALAGPLLRAALDGLTWRSRRDGGLRPAPGLAALLSELAAAETAASGTPPVTVEHERPTVTAGEAAALAGISPRRVRELARAGRLIAARHGRDWQVDRQSAQDYGRRKAT